MKYTYLQKAFMAVGLLLLANACTSGPAGNGSATGGASGSGGATGTGGASGSGGTTSAGGNSASGGTTSSGGAVGSGGSTATGGTMSTDGSKASGGGTASGGAGATGGAQSSGGASGATAGTGGAKASGGAVGSGGLICSGGATSSGGAPGTGGSLRSDGGIPATDGNPATGDTVGGGADGADGSPHTGKWQIMPLGDSITGTTCYPKLLSKELIDKGHPNFTFVGTVLNNQGCGDGVDNVQTEGHGGYLVTYLISDANKSQGKGSLTELTAWAAEKPDVVLMEYGTNDAWSSIAPANITSAYSFVVDQFRGQNPNVIFFVAQITPMNPSGCTDCETRVEALNAQIPTWATGKSTTASPIYVVNVWAALQPASSYTPSSTNTSDGVHPSPAGSQWMADKWTADLVAHGIP